MSQNVAVHQGHVSMSCEADADELIFIIDNQSADLDSVKNQGFVQHALVNIGEGKLAREMTIYLSEKMAGKVFDVFCRAFNVPELIPVDSEHALLKVAG